VTLSGADEASVGAPPPTDQDNDSNTLSVVALIAGALGLAVGIAGLIVARRARAAVAVALTAAAPKAK
jgi:hypothetical protein